MTMTGKRRAIGRGKQSGVMLLEALIGILIFSLGILALVGMQAIAVKLSTDARDRAEASNLASQLIGEMWVNRANLASYAYNGTGSAPAALEDWVDQVEASLPDVAAYPPTVVVGASTLGAGVGTETIVTIRWRNPSDSDVHNFVMTAYIN
jgi:type IV pilus assembly protein PilV